MNRPLLATVALATLSAFLALPVSAAGTPTSSAHPSRKPAAKKPAEPAATDSEPDDSLTPVQLTLADRVLTGVANCELKQTVTVERLEGHTGNFKVTFDKHAWIVSPRETTTGAIVLVDQGGNVEWLQIPKKSMLMNVKLHQRLVNDCQEDEQRIASQSSSEAAANAPILAPSVAAPAAVAAVAATKGAGGTTPVATPAASSAAPAPVKQAMRTTTTTTTTTTVKLMPPAPVERSAQAPDAAASGMFK